MKKMVILTTIIILFSLNVTAPVERCLYIERPKPVYIYNMVDSKLRSVCFYESKLGKYQLNPVSGAGGIMQIMKPMIREVNRICLFWHNLFPDHVELEKFTLADAFDPYKSIRMWYIVQNFHNPEYDLAKACIIWFGAGIQYDGKTWRDYYADVSKIQKQMR